MAQRRFEQIGSGRRRNIGVAALLILAVVLLFGAGTVAGYIIEYQWWQEMGQVQTWFDMLWYGLAPEAAATLVAFMVLWIAHARGMKFAAVSLRDNPTYAKLSTLGLLLLGFVVAAASFDTWTAVRFIGARGLPLSSAT